MNLHYLLMFACILSSCATESAPEFTLLWEYQVDPNWQTGEEQENGITAEFVEFSADGRFVLTGNGRGEAFVLDGEHGTLVKKLVYMTEDELAKITDFNISGGKTKGMEVESGVFSPDGRYVIIGGNLNGVKVFSFDDGTLQQHLFDEQAEVDGMGISPDGQWFAHATKYSATVRSAHQWTPVSRIPHGDKGAVNSVDFSRDGLTMASAGGYGHVVMTRTSDWTEIGDGLVENTSSIKSVRLSPDGQYAAAGYSGPGRVAVFDCATMRLVADIPLCYIEAVAWTSDSRYLLAGGRDGKGNMMLWRAGTWEPAGTLTAQLDGSNIEYIDCWQDRVAVAGEDARVRVWRME